MKEAEKILGDTDEACTFFLGSKHILFTIGEATLVCRLLEGEFLDWRRVLPQNQPVKLAVNVAKMTDSIERVGLIISEKLKSPVRCKFGENTADFRSVSTIGEAHDVCQIAATDRIWRSASTAGTCSTRCARSRMQSARWNSSMG